MNHVSVHSLDYLQQLTAVTEEILADPVTTAAISRLKMEIADASDPFVWTTLDITAHREKLPPEILSAWIFVLKRNTRSVAHYHPDSVQHMAVIEASGEAEIGGKRAALRPFDPRDPTSWYVIEKNVLHEVFPADTNAVVLSFHTTAEDELVEIEAHSTKRRVYETQEQAPQTTQRTKRHPTPDTRSHEPVLL